MLIQITNEKAVGLLHELEELKLIKVLKKDSPVLQRKLSDKYRGAFSKEDAISFTEHTTNLRREWDNS